jgi:cytochrome P450
MPTWEPLSPDALADQRGTYDRMRAACRCARSPRGVTLFRHADVVAAALDPSTLSSAVSAHRQVPNSLDPPEHDAFRAAIEPFLSIDRVRALEPRLRAIARDLLSAQPRGATVEAVTGFGYPFAVRAQAEWLGWQGAEDALLGWMRANHAATRSADRSRLAQVAGDFDAIVTAQVRRRRDLGAYAPADPTTELLNVRVGGRLLSDADIVSILRNWTGGVLGSIAAALGVIVHFLAVHPSLQAALRADRSGLPAAVDEMLRIDDPFVASRRVVARPTRIAGFELDAGTRVYLNWTSANRDATVFRDPEAFRPREHARHNLVYGTGIHVCPGRPLATLELVIATETLLALTSHVELAAEDAAERETYPVGGWRRVPIRLQ